jgi:hypothetical protein
VPGDKDKGKRRKAKVLRINKAKDKRQKEKEKSSHLPTLTPNRLVFYAFGKQDDARKQIAKEIIKH